MNPIPQTRQSLLIELRKHSDEAWSEFLAVYEKAILRFCRGMGLQEADAWDATQDVLAAVHQRIASWDLDSSEGSFRAWLFRVARNISIDVISDRSRGATARGGSEVERVLAELPDSTESHAEVFDEQVQRSLFEWAATQAKSEVREVTWRAFQLTAVKGLQVEEAAAQLGISVGSVYTAKCRVVARIRDRVSQLGHGIPPASDGDSKSIPDSGH